MRSSRLLRVLVALVALVSALFAGSTFDAPAAVQLGTEHVRSVADNVGSVPAVLADRAEVRGKWLTKTLCAVIVGLFAIASMPMIWRRRYGRESVGRLHRRSQPMMRAPPRVRTATI